MITVEGGARWGTAAEIARHLGHGVTAEAVRWWAKHEGLRSARIVDRHGRPQVLFPLREAARIELAKRQAKRGRRRAS